MVRLDNVHNMLTLGEGLFRKPNLLFNLLQRKYGKI
ncbi:unknown [Acholeplasma sp. CAG:878]|nr:unknown [Acholeplasma sp. CAG:878]